MISHHELFFNHSYIISINHDYQSHVIEHVFFVCFGALEFLGSAVPRSLKPLAVIGVGGPRGPRLVLSGGSSPIDWIGSPQSCFLLMEKNHDWQKTL